MGFVKEFKEFAMKGNLVDMAVAVVMGGAFGKVVSAFVEGVVMPPIGLLMGNVDFKDLKFILQKGVAAVGDQAEVKEVAIHYGAMITVVIDFILVAFAVFMVIKGINALKKKQEEAPAPPAAPTRDQELLTEIRDQLAKLNSK